MAYELKANAGNLFRNKYKKEDKHPDFKGSICLPDGTIMDIAAWCKVTKGGDNFFSLNLSIPKEREKKDYVKPEAEVAEDDTPF